MHFNGLGVSDAIRAKLTQNYTSLNNGVISD